MWSVVANALSANRLPTNANALYVVLTSPSVTITSGFCSAYCGWHYYSSYTSGAVSTEVKFMVIGNSATQCPSGCSMGGSVSPNGDVGVDGMLSVVAHEIVEALSDPTVNGWRDAAGWENADKCAWCVGAAVPL